MESSRCPGGDAESFPLAWLKPPARTWETIGSVTLPSRPTTLGEARGGLHMVADDAKTARWLKSWAESESEERTILLRLPGGWFELHAATIQVLPGPSAHHIVRFDRRTANQGQTT